MGRSDEAGRAGGALAQQRLRGAGAGNLGAPAWPVWLPGWAPCLAWAPAWLGCLPGWVAFLGCLLAPLLVFFQYLSNTCPMLVQYLSGFFQYLLILVLKLKKSYRILLCSNKYWQVLEKDRQVLDKYWTSIGQVLEKHK